MKRFLYIFIFLGLFQSVQGQQDPEYTQYMFNQLAYNPAYAGSRETMSATMLFRKQWWGFPGAPTTASLSLHGPVSNERHGLGFNFVHDRLGLISQNFIQLTYAYCIPLKKGHLALGLQGGVTNYSSRYSDIETRDPDLILPDNNLSAWLPRVGTGLYYHTEKFYAGLSAPNILTGRFFRYNNQAQEIADKQRAHYFAMLGGVLPLSDQLDLRPSTTFKYVGNAPAQLDLNTTLFWEKTFGIGAGYRTGDGLVFMIEYISPKYFRFGYAFDYSLNEIQSVSAGSHEFMLGIDMNWGRSRFLTPRYF